MGTLLSMRHQINELITHINGAELAEIHTKESLLGKITKVVAGYYGVTYEELVSGIRLTEPASSAKHVAIYFCTKESDTLTIKTFFRLNAYQSIYYAQERVSDAIIDQTKRISRIKRIDIETLNQYINEKLKQPHTD